MKCVIATFSDIKTELLEAWRAILAESVLPLSKVGAT